MSKNVGYSGKPLWQKLGYREDRSTLIVHAPDNYETLLGLQITPPPIQSTTFDFIHYFAHNRLSLEQDFPLFAAKLQPSGMLWISWYKRSSGITTDLDEQIIREIGLANGLVDIKVCAVSEIWSGLKFVIRLQNRKKIYVS